MKRLFDYCYYRIAKAYRVLDEDDYMDWGYWVLFASFFWVAVAIALLIIHAFHIELTKKLIYIIGAPFFVLGLCTIFFVSDKKKEEKFRKLEEKYKNERFSRLKGWLVFMYIIGTLLLLFVCL